MSIYQPEPCPLPGAGSGSVAEFILCDSGNEGQRFIRKFIQDGAGAVTSVIDLDFEGTLYVVVGPVVACSSSAASEVEITNTPLPVALDAPSLAALETITATVTGTVSVDNFPASVEISNDVGNPLPIVGTVGVANFPAVQTVDGTVDVTDGGGSLTVDGTVALDAGTLAALESVTVVDGGGSLTVDGAVDISNFPAVQTVDGIVALDAGTLAALESITVVDGGGSITIDGTVDLSAGSLAALESITVGGTVALDAPTLAALESVTVVDGGGSITVDGTVALDAGTLAALESVTVVDGGGSLTVDGTVELGATTLAALENITVDGTVALDAGTLAALESITVVDGGGSLTVDGPLTDIELRATPVPVSGTVTITDGSGPVTIDGTVALDAGTLAALESITVVDGGGTLSIDDGAGSITVDGTVALDAGTLAALESITVVDGGGSLSIDDGAGSITVDGTVALDAGTLTALESISANTNDTAFQKVSYICGSAVSTGALSANVAKAVLSLHHAAASTKTVKIRAIDVALVATTNTAGNVTAALNRGTAAPSAGTGQTPAPSLPSDPGADTTVNANPTIVAATPVLVHGFGNLPALGSIARVRIYEWDSSAEQKPLTLRSGVLDSIVVTLTSSAAQTITPYFTIYFTEE